MSGIISDNVGRSTGLIKAAGGGGKIGQVVQAQVTAQVDIASSAATYADIAGLTVDITPVATSSKVLVMVTVNVGYQVGSIVFALLRDSTQIALGDASGSQSRAIFGTRTMGTSYSLDCVNMKESWLDSPSSTSALTYKLQTHATGYTETIRINSTDGDDGESYSMRVVSTITAMEILA